MKISKLTLTVLCITLLFTCCNNQEQKSSQSQTITTNSKEEKSSSESIEEQKEVVEEVVLQYDLNRLFENDSILFNHTLFNPYYYAGRSITETEYNQYQINDFVFYPTYSTSIHILDSLVVDNKSYYSLFFGIIDDYRTSLWMANYRKDDNRFIDSRRLYDRRPDSYGNTDDEIITSLFFLAEDRMEQTRTSYFLDIVYIPLNIDEVGKFEEFPNEVFSNDTITMGPCNNDILYGKYPAGEVWTTLNFHYNEENMTVNEAITQNTYSDGLGHTSTFLYNPNIKIIDFDIAFKGSFPDGYFGKPEVLEENLSAYPDIEEFLSQNLTQGNDNSDDYHTEKEFRREIQNLKSCIINGQKYWFVQYIEGKDYMRYCMVSISPDKKITQWMDREFSFYTLFLRGEDTMLYVQTVPGEGASRKDYVYQIDNGFKLLYSDSIVCD